MQGGLGQGMRRFVGMGEGMGAGDGLEEEPDEGAAELRGDFVVGGALSEVLDVIAPCLRFADGLRSCFGGRRGSVFDFDVDSLMVAGTCGGCGGNEALKSIRGVGSETVVMDEASEHEDHTLLP